MELNYIIVAIVLVIAIIIVYFTTRINLKEKDVLENKIKKTDLSKYHHKENKF